MARNAALLLALLTGLSSHAGTQVYRWVDADGVVHFEDAPPDLDTGTRLKVRPPNLADAFVPRATARQVTARPGAVARPGRAAVPRAEEEGICARARDALRALRDQRRSGYSLAEEERLDRARDEAMVRLRRHC